MFDVPSSDLSIKIIGAVFGGLFGGGNDPLIEGIKLLNAGMLILAGILATYTVLAGTVGTAHDGEMLGKKFSSVWIPIRYSLFTALIVPIKGYCVAQMIVAWLITFGIGMAGAIYGAISPNSTNQDITIAEFGNGSSLELAENAFAASVCVQGNRKAVDDAPSILLKKQRYDFAIQIQQDKVTYGNVKSWIDISDCGWIKLPIVGSKNTNVETGGASNNKGLLGQIDNLFNPVDVDNIIKAHREETIKLVEKMNNAAKKAVDSKTLNAPSVYAEIQAAADEYRKNVETVSKAAFVKSTNDFSKYGWMIAGFKTTGDILANNTIRTAAKSVSQSGASLGNNWIDTMFNDASEYLNVAPAVLSLSKNAQASNAVLTAGNKENKQKNETGSALTGKIGASIAEATTGVNLYSVKDDYRHPLVITANIGNSILEFNALIAVITAGIGAVAGAASLIAGNGVVAAMLSFLTFYQTPINVAWASGWLLSYFIPMIPSIIWIGVLIGWTLLCIEAVIASTLWAVAHLSPNGDGLIPQGGSNGYMLIMGIVLRPSLAILGLYAADTVMYVFGELINKIFFQVFASTQGGTIQGLSAFVSIAFGSVIYGILMIILVRKSYSITFMLSDNIMRWIGGGVESLGQFAQGFGESASGSGEKAAGVGAVLVNMNKGGLQKNLSSLKDRMDKDKENIDGNNDGGGSSNNNNGENDMERKEILGANQSSNRNFNDSGFTGYNIKADYEKKHNELHDLDSSLSADFHKRVSDNLDNGQSPLDANSNAYEDTKKSYAENKVNDYDGNTKAFYSSVTYGSSNKLNADNGIKSSKYIDKAIEKVGAEKVNDIAGKIMSDSTLEKRSEKFNAFKDEIKYLTKDKDEA